MKKRKVKSTVNRSAPPKTQLSRDEVRRLANSKRLKKRKRIRLLVYALLLLCFAGTAIALSLTVFFQIGTVTVSGSSVYKPADIEKAAGIHIGDNLFLTNTGAAAKKITETLPYAGKAVVTRKLPDTLIIEITDTAQRAALDGENGYILIDETGKVLSAGAAEIGDGVAYVTGISASKAVFCQTIDFADSANKEILLTLLQALKNAGIERITEIRLKDINAITLLYDDRITIKAGGAANMDKKLKRAAEAIKDEDKRNPAVRGTLDLTIDPYVYFREAKKSKS